MNRSQVHLSVRVLNFGHWERSRKRHTPQRFHHLIDWDATWAEHKKDPTCGNLFLQFLSNISVHILIMQAAGAIRHLETEVMRQHGWLVAASPDNTLLCGVRATPGPGAYVNHIAGARTVGSLLSPMQSSKFASEMSLAVKSGKERTCLTTRNLSVSCLGKKILIRTRSFGVGLHVVRVCSFDLNNQVAADSPSLCGEMLCSVVADCFHYQVGVIGGDGNSTAYRFGGSKQISYPCSSNASKVSGMPLCPAREMTSTSVPT